MEEEKPKAKIKKDGKLVTNPEYQRYYWLTHPEKYEEHKRKVREDAQRKYKEGKMWSQLHPEERKKYLRSYFREYKKRKKKMSGLIRVWIREYLKE